MTERMLRQERLFFGLGAIFLTCLVVSDIIGGAKIIDLGSIGGYPVVISVGMLAFPLTFVLTDLVNEFYGPKATRFLTYVGLGMLVLTFIILVAANALPAARNTPYPPQWFDQIFGSSLRLIIASLTAYLVGQLIDIFIFGVFKRLSRGKYIWLRATGSTIISQLVDTLIVQFINFGGKLPTEEIWELSISSYVLKFVVAVAMTPLIYLGHSLLERLFHLTPYVEEVPVHAVVERKAQAKE
jgi:uncharacterized integral membrane protein (TIGR00697 family)